jgi:hypothetical protein
MVNFPMLNLTEKVNGREHSSKSMGSTNQEAVEERNCCIGRDGKPLTAR